MTLSIGEVSVALADLAAAGVIDVHVIMIHRAVVATGPTMSFHVTADLALGLVEHTVFSSGAVILSDASVNGEW